MHLHIVESKALKQSGVKRDNMMHCDKYKIEHYMVSTQLSNPINSHIWWNKCKWSGICCIIMSRSVKIIATKPISPMY